jgi:hypothetical protein
LGKSFRSVNKMPISAISKGILIKNFPSPKISPKKEKGANKKSINP